jgi:hypothetical protein
MNSINYKLLYSIIMQLISLGIELSIKDGKAHSHSVKVSSLTVEK